MYNDQHTNPEQRPIFQQQPNYGGYPPQGNVAEVMSVKQWVLTSLVMMIPIVNIIMLFVWGFGGSTNPNKANYAKASLIMMAIGIGLYILLMGLIFVIVGFSIFEEAASSSNYTY